MSVSDKRLPRAAPQANRRPAAGGNNSPHPSSPEMTTQIRAPFVDVADPEPAELSLQLKNEVNSATTVDHRLELASDYILASIAQGACPTSIAKSIAVPEAQMGAWLFANVERHGLYMVALVSAADVYDRLGRATISASKKEGSGRAARKHDVRFDLSVANSYFRQADGLRRLSESIGRKIHKLPAAKQQVASTAAIRDLKRTVQSREIMLASDRAWMTSVLDGDDFARAQETDQREAELEKIATEATAVVSSLPEPLRPVLTASKFGKLMEGAILLDDLHGARMWLPKLQVSADELLRQHEDGELPAPAETSNETVQQHSQVMPETSAETAPAKRKNGANTTRLKGLTITVGEPTKIPVAEIAITTKSSMPSTSPAFAVQPRSPVQPAPFVDRSPLTFEQSSRLTHVEHAEIQAARRAGGEIAVFPVYARLRSQWREQDAAKAAAEKARGGIRFR